MEPDEFFVMLFTFIVVMTVLRYAHESLRRRHSLREKELDLRLAQTLSPQQMSPRQRDHMEERLRVLERIATDRRDDLAAQIEDLRRLDEAEKAL